MKERLVDVLNTYDRVLNVLAVKGRDEDECLTEALAVAAKMHLASKSEMTGLHARMHVDRRGPLAPLDNILRFKNKSETG